MRPDLCLNPRIFRPDEVHQMLSPLRDLLCRHRVRAAYLFGSVLEQTANPPSDLDIAVLPPPDVDNWLVYVSPEIFGLIKTKRPNFRGRSGP